MIRKIVSTTLLVSLLAIASSGIMMILIDSFEFQLRMHPVHKIFGIVMTIAGILHVYYNFKSIKKYLDSKTVLVFGIVMIAIMMLLYVVGFNKPLDKSIIKEIEISTSMLKDL
jgi:hypothetical protein